MKKQPIMISVEQETMDYMEALHYDINSYLFLMKSILTNNEIAEEAGYTYNKETYDHYMKEFRAIYAEYEMTKMQILRQYVPEEHRHLTFNFNFEYCRLESKDEEGGSCNGCKC